MKQKRGAWDGAQPKSHVLRVLREHGVRVTRDGDSDWYELEDLDGECEVLLITDPVLADMVVKLFLRFGGIHGFKVTALRKPRTKH